MIAATLFSGIGAPEVAMPHWNWAWHAEIEKFPSAVMAARHPGSINLGDVSADDFAKRAGAIARPNVLVFGSPCQSFSVAGKRLGLDDPRGNLALVALGIVDRLKPDWFVFENVPGLLSSGEGRDFGAFIGTVADIGYHGCWDVLDAQWFGVAQRRQRLFFVGNPRDRRHSAAVLLEPESLCGDHPPRREAGQRPADPITASFAKHRSASGGKDSEPRNHIAVPDVSHCLNAGGMGRQDYETETETETETVIAHALRAEGHDASEDGTGRGTPIVAFSSKDYGADAGSIAPTLRAGGHSKSHANAGIPPAIAGSSVRRLTPRECERLQGFPDNYTNIDYRGKPAADGPRYKALGNSMAVPVIRWILNRIELFETHVRPKLAA